MTQSTYGLDCNWRDGSCCAAKLRPVGGSVTFDRERCKGCQMYSDSHVEHLPMCFERGIPWTCGLGTYLQEWCNIYIYIYRFVSFVRCGQIIDPKYLGSMDR